MKLLRLLGRLVHHADKDVNESPEKSGLELLKQQHNARKGDGAKYDLGPFIERDREPETQRSQQVLRADANTKDDDTNKKDLA